MDGDVSTELWKILGLKLSYQRGFHILSDDDEFRWQHIFTLRRSQPYG